MPLDEFVTEVVGLIEAEPLTFLASSAELVPALLNRPRSESL
ncbi:hypothetical protein [Streptomyces eurythermus]